MKTSTKPFLALSVTLLLMPLAVLRAADAPVTPLVPTNAAPSALPSPLPIVLKEASFKHYVDDFNKNDNELYKGYFPNSAAWDFLKDNIPLFECPDEDIQRTYYFRWWTYRKHIKQTPDGWIIDEFLPPVHWAGKHNTINCATGHHLMEGRWLRDARYLDDYATFWFRKGGTINGPRSYTCWPAWAIRQRALVTGDMALPRQLLEDFVANYRSWERGWQLGKDWQIGGHTNGLFFTIDDRDGGEVSIGSHGYRPLLNAAMYGEATAIADLAQASGRADLVAEYQTKAARLKHLVQTRTWDPLKQFFMILRADDKTLSDVRELYGYAPWYFDLPDVGYEAGWKELLDPQGFYAPYGPTFAEQRHPGFRIAYSGHECQWNGPSWPYATAITLTGLANLLNGPPQTVIGKPQYFELLGIYARSHRLTLDGGRVVPWIDENLNPINGDWISRTRLKTWENGTWSSRKGGIERGKDYNHSTFCDLVISGLIGLRPRADDMVEVNPLVPADTWDWFCLDHVTYHGKTLTILWDKTGNRYGKGAGLRVLVDGKQIAHAESLTRVTGNL